MTELDDLDQVGGAVIEAAASYFAEDHNRGIVQALVEQLDVQDAEQPKTDTAVAGKTVVFTGALERLTRDEAKNNLFERSYVTTVVHAPFGAHPTSCPDLYGWDMDHLKTYTASAAEEGGWEKYRAEYLSLEGDAYIEKVGGAGRLRKLRLPVM